MNLDLIIVKPQQSTQHFDMFRFFCDYEDSIYILRNMFLKFYDDNIDDYQKLSDLIANNYHEFPSIFKKMAIYSINPFTEIIRIKEDVYEPMEYQLMNKY